MNLTNEAAAMEATRVKISTLWIVVLFNITFADIVGFIHPGALEQMMNGEVGIPITQGILLVFSILLEIPIAMIFLSRVLKPKANRWANSIAGVITAIFVIGGGSATLSYMFFATMEIICIALILWYVWKWPQQEA